MTLSGPELAEYVARIGDFFLALDAERVAQMAGDSALAALHAERARIAGRLANDVVTHSFAREIPALRDSDTKEIRMASSMSEEPAVVDVGTEKYKLLGFANVRWFGDEKIWASQTSNKIFSWEWMCDSAADLIKMAVAERLDEGDWRFWFTGVPSRETQERIKSKLPWHRS
jgi:hypothetical protein